MRYLSIDLGEKRTGIATGDDETGLVSPLQVISEPIGDALVAAVSKAIQEHAPDTVVLGLPLNMDGTEGKAAKSVRAFADRLHESTKLPIEFQDERLTSYSADQRMAGSGRTHKQKKQLRDALAAAEILHDFLDARSS